jgi:hypothetical protein
LASGLSNDERDTGGLSGSCTTTSIVAQLGKGDVGPSFGPRDILISNPGQFRNALRGQLACLLEIPQCLFRRLPVQEGRFLLGNQCISALFDPGTALGAKR